MTNLTFIHLTDLHLLEAEDAHFDGQYPMHKVQRIIERVQAMEIVADFWLLTGDLVNDGTSEAYHLFKTVLDTLRAFDIPVLLGLGNHDARLPFRRVLLGEDKLDENQPYYHSTNIGGLNVIVLDSLVPGESYGHLDSTQLAWLSTELDKSMPIGHLIALHHPPVPSTVTFLDQMVLKNPAELAEVVAGHHVLGILSGHIHYAHVACFQNTISFTTPAVAYTVDPGVQLNLRTLNGSGFSIGTIQQGQLFMNPVAISDDESELAYRQIGPT